jgi:type III secretion protein J
MRRYLSLLPLALLLTGCLSQVLQTGLTEQEAQEIVVLLKENGLEATTQSAAAEDKKDSATWQVKVKGGDQNMVLAWRILRENGLPREKTKGLEEVFANSGMIPTAGEEKARLLVGLSGEISRTLKSVQGVVDARVHVVLPENSPLLDKSQWKPTTASVLVKYQGAQPPLKEEEIKALVARGVEGLQPDNVAIVFKRIVAKSQPPRDVGWYLGNQELLVASLALSSITGLGCLVLIFSRKRMHSEIEQLRRQLAESVVKR